MWQRIVMAGLCLFLPLIASAAELALDGSCAVCLVEAGKIVPGSKQFAMTFDRQTYQFPSAKEKAMFEANPAKYVPVLGGDCSVCKVMMGARMPGKVQFSAIHQQRVYLFPSAKELAMFQAEPQKFEQADIGLCGYCSVCITNARQWVAGKPEHVSVYDGVRYLFPSAGEKKAFDADPAKFTPAFGGDCAVCWIDGKQRVAGNPKFSAMYQGRVFLFPEDGARQKFLANSTKYGNVDLAFNGDCVVCAKMAQKRMPGKVEFASIYKGQRYLFPSAKERAMFDADPRSFMPTDKQSANARSSNTATVAASDSITVSGKTACAGCEFGKRPISDSNSLGIAVISGDKVYIVEGGEKRYPKLFDDRFDSVAVELKGSVKKRDGKFIWIEPTSLARAQ